MKVFVRFERGRDDVEGVVLGPFDWVQQTYQDLRDDEGEVFAQWVAPANEWFIVRGEHKNEFYSDFVVFMAKESSAESCTDITHDCAAAKVTYDVYDNGVDVEQRWDDASAAWVSTGRVYDPVSGAWHMPRVTDDQKEEVKVAEYNIKISGFKRGDETLVANALRLAADEYDKSATACKEQPRIESEFLRYAARCREIADALEDFE